MTKPASSFDHQTEILHPCANILVLINYHVTDTKTYQRGIKRGWLTWNNIFGSKWRKISDDSTISGKVIDTRGNHSSNILQSRFDAIADVYEVCFGLLPNEIPLLHHYSNQYLVQFLIILRMASTTTGLFQQLGKKVQLLLALKLKQWQPVRQTK